MDENKVRNRNSSICCLCKQFPQDTIFQKTWVVKIRRNLGSTTSRNLECKVKTAVCKIINQQRNTVKRNTMYLHYPLHSHSSLTHLTSPPPSSLFDVFSQCPDEMRIDVLIWDGPSSNSPLYSSVYYSHSSVWQTCCNRSQEEMVPRLWMSQRKKKRKKNNIKWGNQTNIVSVTGAPLMWWFQWLPLTCHNQFNL